MYKFYDDSKYISIILTNRKIKTWWTLKHITHITGHTTRTDKSRFLHEIQRETSLSLSSSSMIALDAKAPLKSLIRILDSNFSPCSRSLFFLSFLKMWGRGDSNFKINRSKSQGIRAFFIGHYRYIESNSWWSDTRKLY